jgi:SnoaL-like domain
VTHPFPNFLDELEARTRITDALHRYNRGIDRGNHAYCRQVAYHDGATDDHGNGPEPVDQFLATSAQRHASLRHNMHTLANVIIDFFSAEVAFVESYLIAVEWYDETYDFSLRNITDAGAAGARITSYCRYADIFERRDGRWAIIERVTVFGDMTYEPLDKPPVRPSTFRQQKHGPDDPAFEVMRRAEARAR